MARKARLRAQSGIYHILMQAIRHRDLFLDAEDYQQFKTILHKIMIDEDPAMVNFTLYAYCLMPDHFHLLLKEQDEDVSKVVSRIATAYAHYFNNKYDLDGALYRGRFASEPVEDPGRFNIILRYIHQVPVRQGLVTTPAEYSHSSYAELLSSIDLCSSNSPTPSVSSGQSVVNSPSGAAKLCTLHSALCTFESLPSALCTFEGHSSLDSRLSTSGAAQLCTLPSALCTFEGLSTSDFARLLCSPVPTTIRCLGPKEATVPRPSDGQLLTLIHQLTGDTSIHELMARPYAECLKALTDLRKKGASVRQLERLTGIGRGVIQNL